MHLAATDVDKLMRLRKNVSGSLLGRWRSERGKGRSASQYQHCQSGQVSAHRVIPL
jgi:hypothetical protein